MEQKKMTQSKEITILAVAGGLAFWMANFAISRTPIAAEYRATLSISYYPMLLAALIGGLLIGFYVSYSLLHFFDKIPTKNPILKMVIAPRDTGAISILNYHIPKNSSTIVAWRSGAAYVACG